MTPAPVRYQIVQRQTYRRWPWVVLVMLLWILSLWLAWYWAAALGQSRGPWQSLTVAQAL